MLQGMLFHEQVGSSGPVVIALHGLATAHRGLGRWLAPLASSARLFLPDLLGHGQSPSPDCAYSVRDHLDALQEWRSAAGLADEAVSLVGVSVGAILALHYAAREQEWYGASTALAVTAISTPAYPDLALGRSCVARALPMVWLMVHYPRVAARLCRLVCGRGGIGWTLAPLLTPWLAADVVQDTFAHCWQSLSGTFNNVVLEPQIADVVGRLDDLRLLFLHGSRDRVAPLAHLKSALANQTAARLLVLEGADHSVMHSHTADTVDALGEFLALNRSP